MEEKEKKLKQPLRRVVSNNIFILRQVWRLMPSYLILTVCEGIMWGLINSAEAVVFYTIFNALDTGEPFARMAYLIGMISLFYLISGILDRLYWVVINPEIKQTLHYRMHRELFVRAQSLDLACYDDPKFYNDFVFAMDEADSRAIKVVDEVGKLINRLVASGTLFTLLFTIDTLVAVLIFACSLITTVIWLIGNKIGFRQQEEGKPLWRKSNYINRTFHLADYAKELRTSRASELLMEEYTENCGRLIAMQKRYGKKYFLLYGLCDSPISIGLQLTTLLVMFFKLIAGQVQLGGFAAAVNTIWRVRWFFFDICQRIARFPEHALYIEKYRNFLSTEPTIRSGKTPIPEPFAALELRHVSFAYPAGEDGEAKETLHDINLTLHAGEKIALVGYNGAGKTTLIKLIMRLYDPTEGQILWGGVDIREFDLEEYRQKIGTVFQDFKLFAASIAENVLCTDCAEDREEDVRRALDAADFTDKLESLEDGIHTHLTREFRKDGTNLSGGESQKIAIARVFARPYELIIMDEPSAALDPLAEYALNHNILKQCADSTVIFISHRLSTTRMAQTIYMLADGRIAESGSHEELMAQNGKYAEMFNTQAKHYISEVLPA
ncbi:MAG: ABC transporter ATP-binding protein [Clostridia bacterium]|nr:ABC transporter ATP-binding protein [Clostridia bacterium]